MILTLQTGLMPQEGGRQARQKPQLDTELKQISYILGYHLGAELAKKKEKISLDTLIFLEGIREAMAKQPPLIPDTTMERMFTVFSDTLNARNVRQARAIADSNKRAGEAFLAENRKKEGIVTLTDGLQYKILQEGSGISPGLSDTCIVHYRGTFLDGSEFDNSYRTGEPWKLSINWAIKGWIEALQIMKVGSKWKLWIPPELGYGVRGYKNLIPGNALLVFELELLYVKKGKEPTPETKILPKQEN